MKELEKTVFMTSEEFLKYKRIFQLKESVKTTLSEIIQKFVFDSLEREDEAFNQVAKKFGFPSLEAAEKEGFGLAIDWITREFKLYKVLKESNV